MFCKNCGTQLPDDMKFCTTCGTPVAAAQPPAPQEEEEFISLTQAFDADQIIEPVQPVEPEQPTEDLLEAATNASNDYFSFEDPTPVQPQAPVYQEPSYPNTFAPIPQPEPPKKNMGLIVGITVGLVGIFVLIFCILGFVAPGFLLDKEEETTAAKESTSSSTIAESTTKESKPDPDSEQDPDPVPAPDVDLDKVEEKVENYFEYLASYDMVNCCNSEVLGWSLMEDVLEAAIIDSLCKTTGTLITADEFYEMASAASGYDIYDIETYLNYVASEKPHSATVRINSSKEISKSEAQSYIDAVNSNIDEYQDLGLDSSDIPWEVVEAYAYVEGTATLDGSASPFTCVLVYAEGDWYVAYCDINEGALLLSLAMVKIFLQ